MGQSASSRGFETRRLIDKVTGPLDTTLQRGKCRATVNAEISVTCYL
jgi:hypothetical protein